MAVLTSLWRDPRHIQVRVQSLDVSSLIRKRVMTLSFEAQEVLDKNPRPNLAVITTEVGDMFPRVERVLTNVVQSLPEPGRRRRHAPSGVAEVGAIGVRDDKAGEVVKIVVVKNDPHLTEQALLEHCRKHLTGYKVPKIVEFRAEPLPKSNLGKILRRRLRDVPS